MALEDLTGTKYIDDLNSSNPAAGDNVSEGDDHIRGIKNVLKVTLPNVTGAVTPTHTELNYVDGVTSAVQTQLDAITANDWVTAARMADNSVDSDMYVDASIDLAHMSVNSIDSDQYVDGSIDTAHIANDAITAALMADNSIDSDMYVDASIDLAHMSANSVDSNQYVDGSIDLAHMSVNSIDSDQYVDGSIDTAHLADDAVTTAKIADNVTLGGNVTVSGDFTVSGDTTTVNTATLAVEDPLVSLATGNNSADAVDIGMYGLYDTSGSQDLYGGLFRDASDSGKWKLFKDNQAAPTTTVNTSGTGYAVGTLVANLEGSVTAANSIDSDQYVDGSIDLAHMSANSVDSDQYVDGSIDLAHMSANSVDSDQYVDGSIDTAHIANDAITSALIADDMIDSEHYAAGSIDAAHIASGTITATQMAANSVDSSELVDGSVDASHLAADCVTAAKIGDNVINSEHYAADSIDNEHLSESLGDLRKGVTYIGRDSNDFIGLETTYFGFHLDGAEDMRLENDGDLHVEGDVIAYSTTISDATLKYNINPVEFALDKIKQLKGVTFNYLKGNKASAGLLAQDVEKVMPSAVSERKLPLHAGDDKAYKTLHYDSMTAILVEAIKELTAKVEKLENK